MLEGISTTFEKTSKNTILLHVSVVSIENSGQPWWLSCRLDHLCSHTKMLRIRDPGA